MSYLLPNVSLVAVKNSAGNWEIDYSPNRSVAIVLTKIVITGPLGSTLSIYLDNVLIDVTLRGDINSNELLLPHVIHAGQTLKLLWSLGNGSPATATLMMKSFQEYA